MITRSSRPAVAAVLIVAGCAGSVAAPAQQSGAYSETMRAETVLQDWPDTSKKAAQAMIKKYGQPQEVTATRLIWHDNGPWKRTTVINEEIDHDFPMPHKDVLEQTVNYDVPADRFDDLARYDGSVMVERTRGEISARCDKEEANFLALNLAHEIVTGKRSVDEAREFYATTMKEMMSGKMSPYVKGLRFKPPATAGYSDQVSPIIRQAMGEGMRGDDGQRESAEAPRAPEPSGAGR